ncbi:MAG: hypothetical protein KGZ39_02065 [Simkania sp.]|nr:hypothetical protein [Simkania sp.]
MKKSHPSKVSFIKAAYWITGSVIAVATIGYTLVNKIVTARRDLDQDPRQRIVRIIQTGPQKEALSTLYLSELMQLSIDRPFTMRSFNLKLAEKRLRSSPVVQDVKIFFDGPGTVAVDYEVRQPSAWLYDFVNIGVDISGVPFPIYPFYSPKKLPEIYLGEPLQLIWNRPIDHPKMQLSLSLLEMLAPAPFLIKRIDVGGAFAESYGKKQIVLIIEEQFKISYQDREILCILPRILRLSTKEYRQELGNYLVLRDELSSSFDPTLADFDREERIARLPEQVIDLRIAGMAFLK